MPRETEGGREGRRGNGVHAKVNGAAGGGDSWQRQETGGLRGGGRKRQVTVDVQAKIDSRYGPPPIQSRDREARRSEQNCPSASLRGRVKTSEP